MQRVLAFFSVANMAASYDGGMAAYREEKTVPSSLPSLIDYHIPPPGEIEREESVQG